MGPAHVFFEPDIIERISPRIVFSLPDIKVAAAVIHKNDFDGPVCLGGDTLESPL